MTLFTSALRIADLNSLLRGGGTDDQCVKLAAGLRGLGQAVWLAGLNGRQSCAGIEGWFSGIRGDKRDGVCHLALVSATPNDKPAATKAVFESRLTRFARHFFRWHRNSPIRFGHPLLRRLLRALMARHQCVTLRNGLKMQVDLDMVVQHTIFWYDGDMEPQLSWAVREFLPVGGTLIDCGANCGFIGLEARLLRHARVLFIEPHPDLAAAIRRNIGLNGWSDSCKLVEAAASNRIGTAPLYLCRDYDGSHSLLADWCVPGGQKATVEVRLITLRQVMASEPQLERVDFLKVDTEGHDFHVLLGLEEWLAPDRIPMLYVEMGRDREAACALLQERGYRGFTYPRHLSAVELRRALRRFAAGVPVALYQPLSRCPRGGETLWCPGGSPQERHLLELAERTGG